jgi:ATP-dependent Clp protease adaptor protein ClpS
MSTEEQIQKEVVRAEKESPQNQIMLYNDDVNTFDHVIDMLIQACEHSPVQAEQCAILVHYKGKCVVKSGEINDLKPRCTVLLNAGLSAEVI